MDERTTSEHLIRTSSTLRRRAPQAAAGLATIAAVLAAGTGLGSAAPAGPQADPHVLVVDQCTAGVGPELVIIYTNPTGPGVADFHTSVNGFDFEDVSVLPGTQHVTTVPVYEGTQPVVAVTATGGFTETVTKPTTNCWELSKWAGFECTEAGPAVVTYGTNTGHLTETLELYRNSQIVASYGIAVGQDFSYTVPVAEDASYDVKVWPVHEGWTSVTGYADCEQPAAVPDPDPEPAPAPAPQSAADPTPVAEVLQTVVVGDPVVTPVAVDVTPHFTG